MLPFLLLACRPTTTAPTHTGAATGPTGAPEPVAGVVLVTLDTTRADHLGVQGDPRGLTPSLDRFAEGAVQFSRAHSHAPWTKPSVTTVMTSVLPRDHRVVQWESQLPEDQPTLATALHDAGWRTEAYVSHVALVPDETAFEVGYDHYELSWPTQPGGGGPTDSVTSTHLTDLATEALGRLAEGRQPFLLWVHYVDPHSDYLHHDDLVHVGDDPASIYAEEVAWTDHQLGRLLDLAAAHPELVVAVVADHGDEFQEHGSWEHTKTVYEEVLHVPLLLRAPTLAPRVDDTPVGTMDLAPTLLELVGVPAPSTFRGVSLLGDVHSPLLAETERIWNKRGLLSWPHKVIWDFDQARGELYDLEADPGEQADLWDAEPELARALLVELAAAYPEVPVP